MSSIEKLFNTPLNENIFTSGQRFMKNGTSNSYSYSESSNSEYWYPCIQCYDESQEYYLCSSKTYDTSSVVKSNILKSIYSLSEDNKVLVLLKSYVDFSNSQFEDAKNKIFELRGISQSSLNNSIILKLDNGDLFIIPYEIIDNLSEDIINIIIVMFNLSIINITLLTKMFILYKKKRNLYYDNSIDSIIKI